MNAVEAIGQAGFAAAIFGGFACWFICVINMFRAVQYRKPGVALFPSWYESPFNILFYPSQLTDRGLAARRWCFYGLCGLISCWIFAAIVGLSTGVANW